MDGLHQAPEIGLVAALAYALFGLIRLRQAWKVLHRRAKRALLPLLVMPWVIYLSLAFSLNPTAVFLPCAVLLAVTMAPSRQHSKNICESTEVLCGSVTIGDTHCYTVLLTCWKHKKTGTVTRFRRSRRRDALKAKDQISAHSNSAPCLRGPSCIRF